jgi:hypothetical protein
MKIANWVRTGEAVAFPFTSMPAYTAIPMIPCLFYARLSTLCFALVATMLTWYFTKKGYTLMWGLNRFKGRLCGNRISTRSIWVIRRYSHLSDPTKN